MRVKTGKTILIATELGAEGINLQCCSLATPISVRCRVADLIKHIAAASGMKFAEDHS